MNVAFLPAAEQDLVELFSYIQNELQNPIAARKIATKLLQRTKSLATFPEMGASMEGLDRRFSGYRYLIVDNYVAIYRVTDQVSVVRILYARSDYVQLLQS
ncbi:MAG TPA: type II toxin-antitoxin system RelE/ParE family toxin [Bacillota bacterium]|nr:type II toxin-antitoxin system RelE/ParE family toxin [Bacillota bacterium]